MKKKKGSFLWNTAYSVIGLHPNPSNDSSVVHKCDRQTDDKQTTLKRNVSQ